jgi:hypothetical protein
MMLHFSARSVHSIMGAMAKRRSKILFLLNFGERIGIDRSWNDKSSER